MQTEIELGLQRAWRLGRLMEQRQGQGAPAAISLMKRNN
jgi:hypothetical protein